MGHRSEEEVVRKFHREYLGLFDEEGLEIREGDIIHREDEGITWSVEYYDGAFQAYNGLNSFRHLSASSDHYVVVDDVHIPVAEFTRTGHDTIYCKILGNIYDNRR